MKLIYSMMEHIAESFYRHGVISFGGEGYGVHLGERTFRKMFAKYEIVTREESEYPYELGAKSYGTYFFCLSKEK